MQTGASLPGERQCEGSAAGGLRGDGGLIQRGESRLTLCRSDRHCRAPGASTGGLAPKMISQQL